MSVTCLMANVLLLFNETGSTKLTFKQILEALADEVSDDFKDELEGNILGLCNPRKALILKKDQESKPTLNINEGVSVNKDFTHK
mmetsp:Transcript_6154/g.13068  ORF Transcript_6154/g.13068 Transcript_6154/m.13068 type:complete len:85 (+) Transcript_6154:631-885(+)